MLAFQLHASFLFFFSVASVFFVVVDAVVVVCLLSLYDTSKIGWKQLKNCAFLTCKYAIKVKSAKKRNITDLLFETEFPF